MLKKRIIPKLLLRDGRNVKGVRFEALRDVGSPVSNARIYDAQGTDELIFLDIAATLENRKTLHGIIAKAAEEIFMPFCVGGGVTSVDDMRKLLLAGADKVAINTAAVADPDLITLGARSFGAQCMVVSIDFRREDGHCRVYVRGGTQATGLDLLDHARRMVDAGAGELLITSIDRDGTMQGCDLEAIADVADRVDVPVIASGGCGTLAHMADALTAGKASAIAIGSLFHFTDQSPIKARSYLSVAGVPVR